jgi:hypothetical protein
MYAGAHAQKMLDKAAAINATSGEILTYGDLNHRSVQLARYGTLMGCDRGSCRAVDGKRLTVLRSRTDC